MKCSNCNKRFHQGYAFKAKTNTNDSSAFYHICSLACAQAKIRYLKSIDPKATITDIIKYKQIQDKDLPCTSSTQQPSDEPTNSQ